MSTSLRRFAALSLVGVGLGMTVSAPAAAQAPKVLFACYVPSSGAVYRIKEPNTPTTCGTTVKKGVTVTHVEFSWTDAVGADHGAMTGLGDDDHPQYLLADGLRNSTNGFAVGGTLGTGSLGTVGVGPRMAWYPGKAAFRAGFALGDQFDDQNIGLHSYALGYNATARGTHSLAMGHLASAVADQGVAIGTAAYAGGINGVAMGYATIANGPNSMAFGNWAGTNFKQGAIVFSTFGSSVYRTQAAADEQFVVRAQRFWFGTTNAVTATAGRFIETSMGAYLSTGGTWTNSSDSAKKAGFQEVDGDEILVKLAAMPVRTWNYRSEDSTVRHMGPTAQDFRAAFALGDGDKAIATVDADGVSLAAIQALVRRVAQLEAQNARSSNRGSRR